MSVSDGSSLSSVSTIDTDDELESGKPSRHTLDKYFSKRASPPAKRKRPESPPHEYILADNPDIAVIVMFRARFATVMPKSLPNFGPQDIERGLVSVQADEGLEKLLCALLGLALNRKKDVERAHYTRPLEEALTTFESQWPSMWNGENPLKGGVTFGSMTPERRLSLLKSLVMWSLQSSEAVRKLIQDSYKGQRHEEDFGQPMAVQPWGKDGDKRRHWLVEGLDDTHFRVYRENTKFKGRYKVSSTWWSVADNIDSVKALGGKLREDGSMPAKKLADGIATAVPRFEAGEEKRKRREYRQARKAQFARPDPGMSLYEGRTRGKRGKYTFSDEEDFDSDEPSTKRQRASGISTPAEHNGPVVTASGRQVKARGGGIYGESLLIGQRPAQQATTNGMEGVEYDEPQARTRSGRASGVSRAGRSYGRNYNDIDEMDDESDAPSTEWNSDKNDDEVDDNLAGEEDDDEDEEMSDGLDEDDEEIFDLSKLVTLKLGKANASKFADSQMLEVEKRSLRDTVSPMESTIVLDKSGVAIRNKVTNGESSDVGAPTTTLQNSEKNLGQKNAQSVSDVKVILNQEPPQAKTSGLSSRQSEPEATKLEEVQTIQAPTPPLSDPFQNGYKAEAGLPNQDFAVSGFAVLHQKIPESR